MPSVDLLDRLFHTLGGMGQGGKRFYHVAHMD